MASYVLMQAPTSGATYEVRCPRDPHLVFTVATVPGSAPPKFRLLEGATERGALTSNLIKSRYEIHDGARTLASLVFPAVAFDKTLILTVDGEVYAADGSVFRGVFRCKRDDVVVLEIAKELSIRDTFSVKSTDELEDAISLLTAVAIHSRFYQIV